MSSRVTGTTAGGESPMRTPGKMPQIMVAMRVKLHREIPLGMWPDAQEDPHMMPGATNVEIGRIAQENVKLAGTLQLHLLVVATRISTGANATT